MNAVRRYIAFSGLILLAAAASSQTLGEGLRQADELRTGYDFDRAGAMYGKLLDKAGASMRQVIAERMILCENGRNMLQYATEPVVVDRKTVSRDDFFLYYSHLENKGWIRTPNAFVSDGAGGLCDAVYFRPDATDIVFSAPDGNGKASLYTSSTQDGRLWCAPQPVESCTSSGNEIFPLVSNSGKELYFSSDALAGMGGYDLFVSRWNERRRCWEAPQNLGFPYSSTADDFLFSNTPDGEFTVFASNRGCSADSITIYVLKFENSPIKKPVGSAAEAVRIAAMQISSDTAGNVETATETIDETGYDRARGRLEAVRAEISATVGRISAAEADSVPGLEKRMMDLQALAGRISDTVTALELDLLAEGKSVSPHRTAAGPDRESKIRKHYDFRRGSFGSLNAITVEVPEDDSADYTFGIGSESLIYNELPDGLIYQIQLCTVSKKTTGSGLKGITPVFEIKQPSGKYLYTAGAFRTYKEADAALSKVRKAGFKTAFVIAFKDGGSIAVSKAKALE